MATAAQRALEKQIQDLEPSLDKKIIAKSSIQDVVRLRALPISLENDVLTCLTLDHKEEVHDFRIQYGAKKTIQHQVPWQVFYFFLEKFYKQQALDLAVEDLAYFYPQLSAQYVFSKGQFVTLALLLFGSLIWIYFSGESYIVVLFIVMQLIYFFSITYRMVICAVGAVNETVQWIDAHDLAKLKDEDLPIYSVLVPVFKEENIVSILVDSLKKLDYPNEKLDLIILLEEDDPETMAALKKSQLPFNWRSLLVPKSFPKTKPKACAYGLFFIRGEYVTIFDAEDKPNPDQLKKAYIAHQRLGPQCMCVQAALNFYNAEENLITALFCLEYSYWFDYLVSGLSAYKLPIPLGGTSNHFNVKNLRDIGSWDPYNTTEDADLGIRAYLMGYNVQMVNSTTWEEANNHYWNWIRQRSRWIKGYMQTSLVYNRHPIKLLRQLGWKNWISFQLLITGTPLMLLINPLNWLLFFLWIFVKDETLLPMIPLPWIFLGFWNLIVANLFGTYINLLGVFKRALWSYIPYALLNPFYWMFFHSIAAYKALWQLFTNPFYWEKTEHGISKVDHV